MMVRPFSIFKLGAILLGIFVLISCGKEDGQSDKTLVTFQFPETMSLPTDVHGWGADYPYLASDIKCVGVFVHYPGKPNDGHCGHFTHVASAHSIVGLVPKGGSASLLVDSDTTPTFYLVGSSANSSECPNFTQMTPAKEALMSELIILGESSHRITGSNQVITLLGSVSAGTPAARCLGGPFQWSNDVGLYGSGSDGSATVGASMNFHVIGASNGGINGAYAKVLDMNTVGKRIKVSTSKGAKFSVGDEILWHILGASSETGCNGGEVTRYPGLSGTAYIVNKVTVGGYVNLYLSSKVGGNGSPELTTALTNGLSTSATPAGPWCKITIQKIPHFDNLTTGANILTTQNIQMEDLTEDDFGGGIIALRVSDTLTLNGGGFSVSAKAFSATAEALYSGPSSIGIPSSSATSNGSGGKGNASGSGGGASGESNGSSGSGGAGGTIISCSSTSFGECLSMGGAGGNNTTPGSPTGGSSGGVIYIWAKNINLTSTSTIQANGEDATPSGAGGGGAGSILIRAKNFSQSPSTTFYIKSKGGNGGTGGGAGAGGLVDYRFCSSDDDGSGITADVGSGGHVEEFPNTCP